MRLSMILVNTSVLALASGTALAQTSTDSNVARITDEGTGNKATIAHSGTNNRGVIEQRGNGQTATISSTGDLNDARIEQVANASTSDVQQFNSRNTVVARQLSGSNHASIVIQRANDALAIVNQGGGDGNSSAVEQHDKGGAWLTQFGSGNRSTLSQNSLSTGSQAVIVQGQQGSTSTSSVSDVLQSARNSIVQTYMFDGSAAAPNRSTISQRAPNSLADVLIRGVGNESKIQQRVLYDHIGADNLTASVSLMGGRAGVDPTTQRSLGNTTRIDQAGKNHFARVTSGADFRTSGYGNSSSVTQHGGPGDTLKRGHFAEVWQQGTLDSVVLHQWNRSSSGVGYATVLQQGLRNASEAYQYGEHAASVTQTFANDSRVRLIQYDTGGKPSGGRGDAFRGGVGNNSVSIAQSGDRNAIDATQEGSRSNANVVQLIQSTDNEVSMQQGTSSTLDFIPRLTYDSSANVFQGGKHNKTILNQYGQGNSATVEQLGTGSATLKNAVAVTQSGSYLVARVAQRQGVGASDAADPASGTASDPRYFSGGMRSAEATILQSGEFLSASIDQLGRGQSAVIEQTGSRNHAMILQGAAATNATAYIAQSGSDNSYIVNQTQAGQYTYIVQNGNNNVVTNIMRGSN